MPFRRASKPTFRRGTRKRPIWVNIPFGAVAFTESLGNQLLLAPEDWEASFTGLSIESATLLGIVGSLTIQQTVVGTVGTTGFWGVYVNGANETAVPSFTTTGMSEVDWLRVGTFGTASALSSSATAAEQATLAIAIKAKRKLSSSRQISICAQFAADAASPAGVLGGLFRFLISRG